jgi:hypothetical protein
LGGVEGGAAFGGTLPALFERSSDDLPEPDGSVELHAVSANAKAMAQASSFFMMISS